jgi:hypothetical protein
MGFDKPEPERPLKAEKARGNGTHERFFVAVAVFGFLGLIASASWMWFS